MTTAVMTSKGQIVIPAAIRKHLNIKKGTRLGVIEQEDRIVLQLMGPGYFERMAGFAGTKKGLVAALLKERAVERRREDSKW
jgi:AbrB family looped-hinge helix DNA binding protein